MPGKNGHTKNGHARNDYRCTMELNQSGKYCVRIRASFPRHHWVLNVYFMASSFVRAMKKLEESLQYLQRDEDRLWFWGVDRSDDPNLSEEMLSGAGLRLDHRSEFPRKSAAVHVPLNQPVAAFMLAPVRRHLADAVENARPRAAAAGD
jgi:hypothetical protein